MAKIFQAAGLGIMATGFIRAFPRLMPHQAFLSAILFFIIGWLIQNYLVKK